MPTKSKDNIRAIDRVVVPKLKSNKKDTIYVSREVHEITKVCDKFREPNGAPAYAPLLYHMITKMYEMNKGKVLRTSLYAALEAMGYIDTIIKGKK